MCGTSKPLAIDLFCGLGGWTEGLLAEGYRVVGFDNERHVYGDHAYPAQLVLQDALTIHGRQFKDAALIVASPPCQEFSYGGMPWKRAKAQLPADVGLPEPEWWAKSQDKMSKPERLEWMAWQREHPAKRPDTALFDACFRIQREACEASGRYIPLVVENVRGAQKWVGRSRWNFGSFHLWGDVPALMPMTLKRGMKGSVGTINGSGKRREQSSWDRGESVNRGSPGQKELGRNPVRDGCKQRGSGRAWFAAEGQISRETSSKSPARKAASAMIAKIPLVLSRHIAKSWHPANA